MNTRVPYGSVYYTDGTVSQLGDREYVKRTLNGEANVSDLIVSRLTNQLVLMFASPTKKDGRIVGALIGRRDGNCLSEITNDIRFGEQGYAYMINNQGTIIAYPDQEVVFSQFNPFVLAQEGQRLYSIVALFEQILEEKTGVDTYTFEGQDSYASYAPVEGTDWILVVTADQAEVLSGLPGLVRNIVLMVAVVLAAGMIITCLLGNPITTPIVRVVKHAEAIARLDLSQEATAVDRHDLQRKEEIGALANALKNTFNSLKEIIQVISDSAEQVAVASEELAAATQTAAGSAEEVSKTMEQIAKGAAQQAGDTEEGAAKGMLIGELIEKEEADVQAVNVTGHRVAEIAAEGTRQ